MVLNSARASRQHPSPLIDRAFGEEGRDELDLGLLQGMGGPRLLVSGVLMKACVETTDMSL